MNARTSAPRAAIVEPEQALLGWSLPGGQDHYLKAISELAAGGGFTGEKVMEISKQFDTHFPAGH
jgi:hypothetical protein